MPIDIFGFTIGRTSDKGKTVLDPMKDLKKDPESFVAPETYDGTYTLETGGVFGEYANFNTSIKNENQRIQTYRSMSLYPEVDQAIEDIVNEAIVCGEIEPTVKLDLEKLSNSDIVKKKIQKEFKHIIKLLDFDKRSHDVFRRWYIDSKLYYHILINRETPQDGIQELRPIDPVKIKRFRKVNKKNTNIASNKSANRIDVPMVKNVEEYYIYTNNDKDSPYQTPTQGIKISPDSICYVHSGLIDGHSRTIVGYLHKAIRPLNMLRQIEDAVAIYRISRAPERRIFYIDVGNLPKNKAEQYLRELMNRYRNKLLYDPTTGSIRDDRNHLSMLEDYWLPRREGGKGTEISTLPGGQNLGQMEDVEYLLKKVYRALNVPYSRLEAENGFNMGRSSEITRDEVKFQKFITRLQVRFSDLFMHLLRVQLILKGIVSEKDWEEISENIQIKFARDTYFEELKEMEILSERLNMLNNIQQYIGTLFSEKYVKKNIMKMTDEEIQRLQDEIDETPKIQQEPSAVAEEQAQQEPEQPQ